MFVEKALGKLEKAFGGDAIETRWYDAPLYEFTLEKECSEVTVEGHGWEWRDGDAVVYELTDDGWAKATVYPFTGDDQAMKAVFGSSDGFDDVAQVSGVNDVHKEQIGTTMWDIEVDVAAGIIMNVSREVAVD